jgi:alkylhydroperoxidase/carboxymuconolactone decarboxylase family protein
MLGCHELNNTMDRRQLMSQHYYDPEDLKDFPNITEYATAEGEKFFEYYSQATSAGQLSEREKALIALAVATVRHCPYCIDAYTNKCLSLGVSNDEMMEAVHVGAAMTAGDVLAHATQLRKIIKRKEM